MRRELEQKIIAREMSAIKEFNVLDNESVKKTRLSVFSKRFIINLPQPVIERKDFQSVITDSVHLLINYSIIPCATLIGELFGDLDSRQSLVVAKKLSLFRFYKYYPDSIINFIKAEDKVVLRKTEVSELLKETNSALLKKFSSNITGIKIKNLFVQIFKLKYVVEEKINLDSTISKEFIKDFLTDKNYIGLLGKVNSIPENSLGEVSLKDLIKYLTGKNISKSDSVNEDINESVILTVANDDLLQDKSIQIINVEFENEIPTKDVKTELIVNEDTTEEKVVLDLASDEIYYSDELSDAANDEKLFPTEIIKETVIETGAGELKRLFRPYELKAICKKLFDNNKSELFTFLGGLESCNSWEDVASNLKTHFMENDVDPYDDDVLLFVDVLQEHFTKYY